MLKFPCNKMQIVWDKIAHKLPDNLYTLLVSAYLLESSKPKNVFFNMLLAYSQCLSDNGLKNEFVDKFIHALVLNDLYEW